jgi:ferritin-like metal-binding protein YciE
MDSRDPTSRGHGSRAAGEPGAAERGSSGFAAGADAGRTGASESGYAGIAPGDIGAASGRPADAGAGRWSAPATRARDERGSGERRDLPHRVADVLSIRSLDDLGDQMRANPLATIGVAVGVGFLLERAGLLDAFLAPLGRDRTPEHLSRAERRLLAWLNDAYALEKALIPVLNNHARDARRRPEVRRRDLEHLEETRRHAKKVRQCIEHLGATPSKTKEAIGRFSGMLSSVTTEPFDDEVVRNFVADYAAENLEIASYRAIITAAYEAGHPKIAKVCQKILEDEEEMAAWLRDHLEDAVHDTLAEPGLPRG